MKTATRPGTLTERSEIHAIGEGHARRSIEITGIPDHIPYDTTRILIAGTIFSTSRPSVDYYELGIGKIVAD